MMDKRYNGRLVVAILDGYFDCGDFNRVFIELERGTHSKISKITR